MPFQVAKAIHVEEVLSGLWIQGAEFRSPKGYFPPSFFPPSPFP